ncbi:MAG: hypothetical protein KIT33_06420 [Candidatus Kapabacteria bacterium]|nr:hypothetical protein [Ignavibacteriota bacterium]MCW5884589.1 hypothetical protein [Candidatus Kapabacteria bacterium]
MKNLIVNSVILMMSINLCFSQLDVDFNSQSGYTANSFNGTAFNSPISSNSLSLSYSANDNFNLWGGAGIAQYFNFSERNYLSAFLGTGYSGYTNSDENASLSIYGTLLMRQAVNLDDNSDTRQYFAGIGYTRLIDEGFILNLNSDFKYKTFNLLNELDFIENSSGITLNKSFQTKTAIKLSSNLHTKFYYSIPDDAADMTFTRGGRVQTNFGSSALQLRYSVQIAQNIIESTGISVQYEGSNALNYYDTPVNYIGYDFAGDSEFFDDPFSFVNSTYSLKLTHILPFDIKSTVSYSLSDKEYNYEVNMFDDDYEVRKDKSINFGISFERRINFEKSLLNNMKIILDYYNFYNSSNFDMMNYKGNFIILGIELGI